LACTTSKGVCGNRKLRKRGGGIGKKVTIGCGSLKKGQQVKNTEKGAEHIPAGIEEEGVFRKQCSGGRT